MEKLNDSRRAEFEAFMADRFKDSIDRRRCKNGDGNDYMSWDMNVARAVWQHLSQRAEAAEAKLAELATQEPVAYTDAEEMETLRNGTYADMFTPCDAYKSDPQWIPLFTRPAPAADLVKQNPRYQIQKKPSYGRESVWIDVASREEAEANVLHGYRWRMVYDAPAPAADLAELVPDGWKLVPGEPTKEMRLASRRYVAKTKVTTGPGFYRAMLAAAPTPSE
ncbi:hypothetical protein [Pantoea agglomerans]|uniref:hypothetical protein n=1 Tax=Enterobacter agglomerans TaxID=549 RepID=UPI0013B65079|nr:hypothetical protein [Pantoea agglomerans]NEG58016.1 hypothetical protein [Pantoea agglomerans]NEG99729.1 hypothetical protein [Pantoea agglomerans]NEH04308.1 hypothetical protein [Pantoea agglomerans]NEH14289.1 hypothetical protein [Pantoea agglomerans]